MELEVLEKKVKEIRKDLEKIPDEEVGRLIREDRGSFGGKVEEVIFGKDSADARFEWRGKEFYLYIDLDENGNVKEEGIFPGELRRLKNLRERIEEPELREFISRLEEVLVKKWKELKEELVW